MVCLNEIKEKRKIKVLLKGVSGVGKTYTCMKIADVVIRAGKNVLYLDHERGSIEEIVNYFEDNKINEVDNFIHEDYFTFVDLIDKIKKYAVGSDLKVDLIVIDPLPLLQICRISATEHIKKQKFYYMGEKVVKLVKMAEVEVDSYIKQIENKDVDNVTTYALRGWQYQIPNDWELKFKDMLVSISPDVVATLMLPDAKNTLDGSFDYIIELNRSNDIIQEQKIVDGKSFNKNIVEKSYKGVPKKIRGERKAEVFEIVDPWKAIIKPFNRKYLDEKGV